MRILIVCEQLNTGGVETRIVTTAKQWSAMGLKVIVASAGGGLVADLVANGPQHIELPLLDNAQALKNTDALREIIQCESIDLLHIHPYRSLLPGVIAAWMQQIPYVITIHGTKNNWKWAEWKMFFKEGFIDAFMSFAFSRSAGIIAVSAEVSDYIYHELKLPLDHVDFIPNSVDHHLYHIAPLDPTSFTFLIASRLDPDKLGSIHNALALFSMYKETQNSHAKLWVAGAGKAQSMVAQSLEKIDKKYGPNSTKMLGPQNRLWEIIPQCHVVMGLGRVIIEAGMCGRIPVISWMDGIRGVIQPENIDHYKTHNFTGRGQTVLGLSEVCQEISNYSWTKLQLTHRVFSEQYSSELWAKKEADLLRKFISSHRTKDDPYIQDFVVRLLRTGFSLAEHFPPTHMRWLQLMDKLRHHRHW